MHVRHWQRIELLSVLQDVVFRWTALYVLTFTSKTIEEERDVK
jgi:hypothetical protein